MITYFNNGLLSPGIEENEEGALTKKALILAEGDWLDSKKRPHSFSADRIKQIAYNTNTEFNNGSSIPILKDHKKDVDGYCGQLDSEIEVKRIEAEDLPMESRHKLGHLVGRLGLFASKVLITANDVASKVKNGLKTISPGIDVAANKIREISITPMPAIPGMSLFMQNNSKTLTWDDLDQNSTDLEELKEGLDDLHSKFFSLVSNIYTASENELNGRDPMDLLNEAVQTYFEQIAEAVGLNDMEMEEMDEEYMPENAADAIRQQQMMGGMQGQYPQQGVPQQMVGYSMVDTLEYLSEFATEQELAEFGLLNWGKHVGKQLDAAYKRGRDINLARSISKKNNLEFPKSLNKQYEIARGTKKMAAEQENLTGRSLYNNMDRVHGALSVGKQVGKNVGKFYGKSSKGFKPRWGRIAGTAGVAGTGVGTQMYLDTQANKKRSNRFNFNF